MKYPQKNICIYTSSRVSEGKLGKRTERFQRGLWLPRPLGRHGVFPLADPNLLCTVPSYTCLWHRNPNRLSSTHVECSATLYFRHVHADCHGALPIIMHNSAARALPSSFSPGRIHAAGPTPVSYYAYGAGPLDVATTESNP